MMGAPKTRADDSESRRILLVEFLADCNCVTYHEDLFPYLQGYLRSAGVKVHWTYLLRTDQYGSDPKLLEPPPAHVDAIVDRALALAATVVIASQTCGDAFNLAIRARVPGARLIVLSDDARANIEAISGLGDLLGFSPAELAIMRHEPDFSSEPLLSSPIPSFPPVRLGYLRAPRCLYLRRLEENPHYAEVDTGGVRNWSGCSFCLDGTSKEDLSRRLAESDGLAVVATALRRFAETAPPERRGAELVICDPRAFPGALEAALELPLSRSTFYFVRRADEVLRAETVLRQTLPRLAERGHRVILDCMGVENLSPRENDRLNKGLSPAEVEQCWRLLDELETRWPETLGYFGRPGARNTTVPDALGFMMILFTPWTEVEDLAINLAALERLARTIAPLRLVRYQLASRLKLFPGAAITRLAEHDGLLVRDFSQPVPNQPVGGQIARNSDEIPWRFRSDHVAAVYRIMAQIVEYQFVGGAQALEGAGRLRSSLSRLRQELESGRLAGLQLFGWLLESVPQSAPPPRDEDIVEQLLRRSMERSPGGGRDAGRHPGNVTAGDRPWTRPGAGGEQKQGADRAQAPRAAR